jgi:Flp pilus assembly protein TadG
MIGSGLLSQLRDHTRGTVVIETAIVAPVLILLALGSFDASRMVARQNELQSAAAEAEAIAQASVPTDSAARDELRDVLKASIDPNGTDPDDDVTVVDIYRCGGDANYVTVNNCANPDTVSTFVKITLTDTYTPQWTSFGIGSRVNYNIVRMVQIA